MPLHDPAPGAVIAVVGEDGRFDAALERAVALATRDGVPLVLYDWDAPSPFSEPLPSFWSSEGWDRRVPDRLGTDQLEAAGRAPLAERVRQARAGGADAYGWLPSDSGIDALLGYARAQGARTVVLPTDLADEARPGAGPGSDDGATLELVVA